MTFFVGVHIWEDTKGDGKMRCAGYVRVSTEDQKDNGFSIDSQLRMIKEYCVKENYDLIDIYNDAGCSGKDLMRPDMQRLLKVWGLM